MICRADPQLLEHLGGPFSISNFGRQVPNSLQFFGHAKSDGIGDVKLVEINFHDLEHLVGGVITPDGFRY
jgi:hypothetical protein